MESNLPSKDRRYMVCDGRAAGAHFGVDSCRACAAFFRRTLQTKGKYVCAYGRCGKPRECKGCRFDRCISSGMRPSLVTGEDSQSIPAVITSHPNIVFLHGLLANYKKLINDRVIFEQAFLKADPQFKIHSSQNMPPNEQHEYIVYTAEYTLMNQISKMTAKYLRKFIASSFQDVAAFDEEEKFLILRNCLFVFHCGEGTYRAAKAYAERPLECFFTSYTTAHRHFDICRENVRPQRHASEHIAKCEEALMEIRDNLVPIIDRLKPTELEFLAAITIAIFTMDSARRNQKIVKISEHYRMRIFYELHVLYKEEFKLDNYAMRMGELMTLAHSLETVSLTLINVVRLFDIFNAYEDVCNGRPAGDHFGVDSCRGCAAFFRRTLLTKRHYECPSGQCGMPRECKGCRFDRCMSSGMLPSLVAG